MQSSVVILASGGVNSTVAACRVLHNVTPHFLYVDHQHNAAPAERRAAKRICEALGGIFHVVQLPSLALTENNAPDERDALSHEQTENDSRPPGVMLTMLGLAQHLAWRLNVEEIVCGASQRCNESTLDAATGRGDADSRHVFFHAGVVAMEMAMPPKHRVTLDLPFIGSTRTEIIQVGFRLGAPLHMTWSCHKDGDVPCGACPGCDSRSGAFDALGVDDPRLAPAR